MGIKKKDTLNFRGVLLKEGVKGGSSNRRNTVIKHDDVTTLAKKKQKFN